MYLRTPTLALLLTAGLVAADEKKDEKKTEWTTYALPGQNCEIQFPGKPREKIDKDSAQALLETMGGKAVYLLQANTIQQTMDMSKEAEITKLMDLGRDEIVRALKAKVEKETPQKFDNKYPARDIDLEAPGIGQYKVRFVMTPKHFYQVTLAGPKEFVDSPDAKKFMDSFNIKQ